MKTAFKAWNILILAFAVLRILGSMKNGLNVDVFFTVVGTLFSLVLAYSGFRGDYSLCKKLASIVLVLSTVSMVASGFAASAVFVLIIVAVYLYMCISLDTKY
ncbi:MAG: hypothetical protein IJK31_08945 [Ruminococcus sp.]|nr:hypothetical protein [Ruminococcus sp.]